jgi:hypothetical protein
MRKLNPSRIIVLLEVLGFGLIILFTWLDELVNLPSRLFGGEYHANYPEALMETLITLVVAIPVILMTRKLLRRLHYLEDFLRVCAWCRRVEHDGNWLPMEEYFQSRFDTQTTHGMCQECYAKTTKDLAGN